MTRLRYFRRIAAGLDPQRAVAEIERRQELYSLLTLRQDYPDSAHRDTESIYLRGPTTTENLFDNLECVDYQTFAELPITTRLIQEALGHIAMRESGRTMIVKLKSRGRITPHTDQGAYARYFARLHLVLQSTRGCIFTAGDESVHMAAGELWWFNHQVVHGVTNMGPDRTHVIIDVAAPGFTGALAEPA